MSVTYSETKPADVASTEEKFVPSYARGARRNKPVKTWMILAPIGALALIGGAAVLTMSDEPGGAPLVEAPVERVATPLPAPLESASLPSNASLEMVPAATPPVTRDAPASTPPAVRVRQAASATAPLAVEPAARRPAPEEAVGVTASAAPAAASVAGPPAPSIRVTPLG